MGLLKQAVKTLFHQFQRIQPTIEERRTVVVFVGEVSPDRRTPSNMRESIQERNPGSVRIVGNHLIESTR